MTGRIEELETGIAAVVHQIDELRAENTRLRELNARLRALLASYEAGQPRRTTT